MDPRTGPVTITISGTSAALMVRLQEGLSAEGRGAGLDGGDILMRALGLLDLALKAKREGKVLGFYDPAREELAEVAF